MRKNLEIWKEFYDADKKDWKALYKDTGHECSYEDYMKSLEVEYANEWENDNIPETEAGEYYATSIESYIRYRFETDGDPDVDVYDPVERA